MAEAAAAAAGDEEKLNPADYSHSPAHFFVLLNDLPSLSRLLSSLPSLSSPSQIHSLSDADAQSSAADQISASLDRRDVPGRDTPLHLAVRLSSLPAASSLLSSGADPSLQNSAGWTPLQESLCLRRPRRPRRPRRLSLLLLRHHRLSAYSKFRRRLPSLLAALARIPDFYLELSFHFESSLIPFLLRAAPSDTYRIWKRGADLRADTTLAGFDGLRVRRADQSFIFSSSSKSLIVMNRGKREARDAFEGLDSLDEEMDERELIEDASAYRPGLDITGAELVKVMNWRRKERVEAVGEWRAKVYEMQNVVFSFKTLKAVEMDIGEERVMELELDEEAEEGYIVAEIPSIPARHSCYERGREEVGVEVVRSSRRSLDVAPPPVRREERRWENAGVGRGGVVIGTKRKEKETVKNLRPTVWLTEDFPMKTEELIPILDILANKVKAVRRLRELITTKFPPGTFPVKVSIPIVPTVRVVVTFTKFVDLQPAGEFFTPLSSPRHLSLPEEEEHRKVENGAHKNSWLKWGSSATKSSMARSKSISPSQVVNHVDPFSIPSDYTWISIKNRNQSAKKSKSRKGKQKEMG